MAAGDDYAPHDEPNEGTIVRPVSWNRMDLPGAPGASGVAPPAGPTTAVAVEPAEDSLAARLFAHEVTPRLQVDTTSTAEGRKVRFSLRLPTGLDGALDLLVDPDDHELVEELLETGRIALIPRTGVVTGRQVDTYSVGFEFPGDALRDEIADLPDAPGHRET